MSERAPMYLPVIQKDDFIAFRKVMNRQFQNKYRSFADWTAQHHAWAAIDPDFQPTAVMVRSVEFSAGERHADEQPGLDELLVYAREIGEVS